jgi:hypothetical protein
VIGVADNIVDDTVSVGLQPFKVVIDHQNNQLFVSDSGQDDILVLDATDLTLQTVIGVGDTPTGMAITPDDTSLLVVNNGDNTVDILRLSDFSLEAAIAVGLGPQEVIITPDGKFAFVTNTGTDDVTIINLDSLSTEEPNLAVGNNPLGLAVTSDGRYVLVVNRGDNSLAVITESPFITISSINPSAINNTTHNQATITWSSDQAGSFQVEVGGNGNKDTGVVIATGSVEVGQTINSVVQASSLAQGDGNYEIFVHVTSQERGTIGRTSTLVILDTIPPSAPTNPAVEIGGSGILSVSWTGAVDEGSGVSRYKVYFGTSSGNYDAPGSPLEIGNVSEAILTELTNGVTYFVAVSAVDGAGNEGPKSVEVSGAAQEVEGAVGSGGGCFVRTVGAGRNFGFFMAMGLWLGGWLFWLGISLRRRARKRSSPTRLSLWAVFFTALLVGAPNAVSTDLNFTSISWSVQAGYLVAQGERVKEAYDGGFIGELNLTWMNMSNFETSAGVGFVNMNGSALDADGKKVNLDARLWYVPADLTMKYRFQFRENQKFIPYVDAGLGGAYYQEEIQNREQNEHGWTYGYQGSLGLRLDMRALAPRDTTDLMRTSQIRNVYLFLEGRYSVIDRFGKEDFDLGGMGVMTGVEIRY